MRRKFTKLGKYPVLSYFRWLILDESSFAYNALKTPVDKMHQALNPSWTNRNWTWILEKIIKWTLNIGDDTHKLVVLVKTLIRTEIQMENEQRPSSIKNFWLKKKLWEKFVCPIVYEGKSISRLPFCLLQTSRAGASQIHSQVTTRFLMEFTTFEGIPTFMISTLLTLLTTNTRDSMLT